MLLKGARTKIYTVQVNPSHKVPYERAEFIEEGLSFWGFFFHGFWLLYHRAWLAGIVTLAVWSLCVGWAQMQGIHPLTVMIAELAIRLFIAVDGNDLRRNALKRRGYILSDIVASDSLLAAKQRFLQRWIDSGQRTDLHPYGR